MGFWLLHLNLPSCFADCYNDSSINYCNQAVALPSIHKGEENERMNVEERPKGVRSPLLQRLIATASSMTMSEHAAQLLLALNTDAVAFGDKLNLFLCEGGRFP
jgi:DNA mismatch repair protein MSH3